MNKSEFVGIMNQIRKAHNFENNLRDAYQEYNGAEFFSYGLFVDPVYEEIILSLLEDMMNDQDSQWIAYWVYGLDCGRDWKPGKVIDENDRDIKLSSAEDLWNFLIELDA